MAGPKLQDPYFGESVLLICEYNHNGALGFIINKATNVEVNEVLRQCDLPTRDVPKASLWGGPVGQGSVFILFEGSVPQEEGWNIELPEHPIAVGTSVSIIEKLIEEDTGFEIVLGYSGWGPGQLDREIQTGSWLYSDLSPDILLSLPSKDRYEFAIEHLGLQKEKIWMNPIDE
ncbi:MAG: YqgE/AlgH family protein [Myxococcota bacterium]|nr:YqgE/AlgH family protein [Myxococcota bacterium]